MSNRARRKYLFRQRLRAGVHAGTLPNDLESLGDVRHAFRAIRRPPLRMPNLESMDNLGDIQSMNSRPDDDFDLLDDDLDLLHEGLHDFIGWEDYMEAIEKTTQAFNAAREILDPLRRVIRWKFNWRDPSWWDDGYLDEVVDYIAPIRRTAREIWYKAYSITKHLRGDDDLCLASWWLPSTSTHRHGRWPVWPPFDLSPDRVPDYAALAIVAMHQAFLASMAFQKIVCTLDEEAQLAGIDPEDDKGVSQMRERMSNYERGEARYAYSLLDEAKDYITAARLAVSQELGVEELQRQVEKAQAQAVSSAASERATQPRILLAREFIKHLIEEKTALEKSAEAIFRTAWSMIKSEPGGCIAWGGGAIYAEFHDDDRKLVARWGEPGDTTAKRSGKPLGRSGVSAILAQLRDEAAQQR